MQVHGLVEGLIKLLRITSIFTLSGFNHSVRFYGAVSDKALDFVSLHRRVLVHLLYSHAFGHETYPFLQCDELLVCHDVRIDRFSKQMQPFICHIKLIHACIVSHQRSVKVQLLVQSSSWVRPEHRSAGTLTQLVMLSCRCCVS